MSSEDLCPCCQRTLPALDDLIVDADSGILVRRGRFAALTAHEFELFGALQAAAGRVRSKEQLVQDLYWLRTDQEEPAAKIIDVWVCKIRKKIKPLGIEIQTLWGRGWRFVPLAAGEGGQS